MPPRPTCALPRLWPRCDPPIARGADICGDQASLSSILRIDCRAVVDFRKRHDGLAARVQRHLQKKPFDDAVYVFRAKRADRLKMIPLLDKIKHDEGVRQQKDTYGLGFLRSWSLM
ncbi:transposase [Roseobacter fucihabitans]|uniref:transposase n=1 Tax=Roseobacter fucihabitans TaxID=1537242 RepID=UPI0021CCA922|nr:transposase [Roseobacter litoralis]